MLILVENAGIMQIVVENAGIMLVYWPKYPHLQVNPHLCGYCGNTGRVNSNSKPAVVCRPCEWCWCPQWRRNIWWWGELISRSVSKMFQFRSRCFYICNGQLWPFSSFTTEGGFYRNNQTKKQSQPLKDLFIKQDWAIAWFSGLGQTDW